MRATSQDQAQAPVYIRLYILEFRLFLPKQTGDLITQTARGKIEECLENITQLPQSTLTN